MRRLLLHPLALLGLLHLYAAWRLLSAFPGQFLPQGVIAGYLAVSFTLIPLSMTVRRRGQGSSTTALAWMGFIAMGLFSSVGVLTMVRDLVLLGVHVVYSTLPGAIEQVSAILVFAAAALASLLGFAIARKGVRVRELLIPIHGLPQALQGFRIAQISDIHVGGTIGRDFLDGIVRRVNALGADVVAVTGDVVDGTVSQLRADVEPLRDLASAHGTFLVIGNHEYYSGEPEWTHEFRRLGLHVLKNRHVVLDHHGERLLLAGVTDTSAHHFDPAQRSDPAAAARGAPAVGVRILLAHRPASADDAQRAGFDLQLSGHTHGGQFWPWNLFVGFFNPYSAGLSRQGSLWVYVNRGTGYWGPPMRLGIPGEITLIRLAVAPTDRREPIPPAGSWSAPIR